MCRLLETIKVKNGELHNVNLHNERLNRSRLELFDIEDKIKLENEIFISYEMRKGNYKCRIIYEKNIEKIELTPYKIPKINSLKIVHLDSIQYSYKFENREAINQLYLQKEQCDDILIVRNGMITDTSFCNIIFNDGNKLITPSTPLLKGVKREQLLREGKITENEIKLTDIHLFKKAFLINAMIELEDNVEISINKII
ncbi:MAG: aminotransferase class IV [Bacteroidales bacterium]